MRKPGCCPTCGVPVYEILQTWDDKPHMALLGEPLQNRVELVLVMSDGSTASMSACKDCAEGFDLVAAWKQICLLFKAEGASEDLLKKYQTTVPIGILHASHS